MSWSVNFIGKSEKVIKALENESVNLTGDSKEEFETLTDAELTNKLNILQTTIKYRLGLDRLATKFDIEKIKEILNNRNKK